ncbi:MAG TPA: hypothetical protein VFA81_08150 [Burkholderiales bacterium]|nr:hypothetical protein [Burkholderiales bacterium]
MCAVEKKAVLREVRVQVITHDLALAKAADADRAGRIWTLPSD